MPGEISLAHNGVLFLDELPEFRRSALEVLRQSPEEGRVTIARVRISVDYPARFMLVASMNPCRCGYLNELTRNSTGAGGEIQTRLVKVSGPLMDRIHIHVEVMPVPYDELNRRKSGPPYSARGHCLPSEWAPSNQLTFQAPLHQHLQRTSGKPTQAQLVASGGLR